MKIQRRELLTLALLLAGAAVFQYWLQSRHEHARDALGPRLAALARPGDIEMFSTTDCIYCARARAWLNRFQVPFTECKIDLNTACMERFQRIGAQGTPVFLVKGQAQMGFDPAQLAKPLGITDH